MKRTVLRIWELALLLALCAGALGGVWAQRTHDTLSGQLVRLHVLAVDDSEEEQTVKLAVRDAVLTYLQPVLADAESMPHAQMLLESRLPMIRQAASTAAAHRPVSVTLTEEYYPSRQYDGFALPAGQYLSLRIILGEGAGRNWWCVVYPPLCTAAATEAVMDSLDAESAAIITEQEGYVYKFRLLELWGQWTARWK